MATEEQFKIYRKDILKTVNKIIRYKHHIIYITTCLNFNNIPNGFTLKFHNNMAFEHSSILRNCSKKLMSKTNGYYKKCLRQLEIRFLELKSSIVEEFHGKVEELRMSIGVKQNSLENLLQKRRLEKFKRDGFFCNEVLLFETRMSENLIIRFDPDNLWDIPGIIERSELSVKDEILQDQFIPDHNPIVLAELNGAVSEDFLSLCSLGPSFIPVPVNYDWLQLQKDFDKFRNSIRAYCFFHNFPDNKSPDNIITGPPRQPSKWTAPPSKIPEVEVFLSSLERDLFDVNNSNNFVVDNLTKNQRHALNQWRKDNLFNSDSQLITRLQDKGNRIVIVDKETDTNKVNEQIDRSSFKRINFDPTNKHIDKVEKWANKWLIRKQITSDWKDYIINRNATPGTNSALYKTHKAGTPVRLLTSGCNTAIERLSTFVETVCAPIADKIETRIKDTGHLLDIIDVINANGLPLNPILFTLDIVNMFPSIDNNRGMEAVRNELIHGRDSLTPSTRCIMEALEICLFNNNSTFGNQNLIQTNGTATGAPNSCSYADLALYPIDKAILDAKATNFNQLCYFGRFRDDCFGIWSGTYDEVNVFVDFVNSLDENLVFKIEPEILLSDGTSVTFLDLKITIVNNQLFTTVYSKDTDSHLYLHGTSCHVKSSVNGIPKGVALRLRRLCSTDDEYEVKSREYMAYLVSREHDPNLVKSTFSEIGKLTRHQARNKRQKTNGLQKSVIFPSVFNPRGPNVSKVVQKHLPLLENNPAVAKLFPKGTILVANKRASNLRDLLIRSDPYRTKVNNSSLSNGYIPCNSNCDSCNNFVIPCTEFKCFATDRIFKVRDNYCCKSKNVIYLAYCIKCSKQGVGSTVDWKPRLSNYKSHINKKVYSCHIVKHFINDCSGHPLQIKFHIIDSLNNVEGLSSDEIDDLLLQKEQYWIGTLLTQYYGLNSTHDWKRKRRNDREKII